MKKKVLIISVCIFILLIILSFFISRQQREIVITPPSISEAQSVGTSPRYPLSETPVIFTLSPTIAEPPSAFPEYSTVFSPNLDSQVTSYAASLGFSTPSRTSERFLEWVNDNGSLLFNKQFLSVSLSQNPNAEKFYTNPEEIVSSLSQFFSFPPQMNPLFLYSKTSKIFDGNSDLQPVVTEYAYTISETPVTYSATDPSVFIIHTYEPNVFSSLMFRIPPESLSILAVKPTFTKEQIPMLLEQNKGVIQSIGSATNPNSFETLPSFTQVEIQTLTVSYLLLPEENRLVPIYILEGVGTGNGEVQNVRYVLRATT